MCVCVNVFICHLSDWKEIDLTLGQTNGKTS